MIKIKFKIEIRGLQNETPLTGQIGTNKGKGICYPSLKGWTNSEEGGTTFI